MGLRRSLDETLARLPREFGWDQLQRYVPIMFFAAGAGPGFVAALRSELRARAADGTLKDLGGGAWRRARRARSRQPEDALDIAPGEVVSRQVIADLLNLKTVDPLRRGMFKPAKGAYSHHLFLFHDGAAHPDEEWHHAERTFFVGQGLKGDQTLTHFNATLRDHLALGLQVHHFTTPSGARGKVRYEGEVVVRGLQRVERADERRSVVEFELVPAGARAEETATSYGRVFSTILQDSDRARMPKRPRVHDLTPFMRVLHDAAFTRLVCHAYGGRCAVCGVASVDVDGQHDLGVATIRSLREGGPYAIPNGLALCARHRWMFDHGVFTLSDRLKVEWPGTDGDPHGEVEPGTSIVPPEEAAWRPGTAFIRHHRKKWRRLWRQADQNV